MSACQEQRADKAYLRGDYGKTAQELQSLANLNEARAQYDLAPLYDKGLGVPQSDAQAFHWYALAAEHGDRRAQYNLGLMYMNGQGMTPNLIRAYCWLSLSLAQGDENATTAREYLIETMTHEQVEEGKDLVRNGWSMASARLLQFTTIRRQMSSRLFSLLSCVDHPIQTRVGFKLLQCVQTTCCSG